MRKIIPPKFVRKEQWEGLKNPVWNKKDKKKVTILYNMVEENKSFFLQAYFHRRGYKYRDLGNHTKDDFLLGREYATRMQCNPVYFTLGTFIDELLRIEKEEQLSKEEIVEKYIFLGGGGQCGPCRYGMYPEEYWKVTNAMGFKDFRVLVFNSDIIQDPPMPKNSAFKFSPYFKINFVLSFILGDLIHVAECAIRPYAKDKAAAMEVIEECRNDILKAFKSHFFLFKLPFALYKAGKKIAKIEKLKKKVPLIFFTFEIFANLAHGDGNYNLRRFIADEGCEVIPGMFTQRGVYEGWSKNYRYFEHLKYAKSEKNAKFCKNYIKRQNFSNSFVKGAYKFLDLFYKQKQFGGRGEIHDLEELAKLGHDYYHTSIFGGEGNLEVAEAIFYHDKIDGFISVKPFGCMPSSGVSDGVQSKIIAMYPNLNFLSIETSGDNEVNILSRVSMMLFKAKQKLEKQEKNFDIS
jgi:predicted nucleotide-binding protein (sugar kinase/HSP70/actin superfamily)